jgi:acetyl esterase/lipase
MKFLAPLFALGLFAVGYSFAAESPAVPAEKADPAAKTAKAPRAPQVPATQANVHYGDHEREVLDFWQAKSDRPTPLVLHIHGGGWVAGDKARVPDLEQYLAAGISVVSINYRYIPQAVALGIKPPVRAPLEDAARALQFVRSQAKAWNIDPVRIGLTGGSAGACSSLYLAFHPDLADPRSADPVARQSTRVWCAAVNVAQTSLDPQQMREWTPNSRYGGHAFGFGTDPSDADFAHFLAAREEILPWLNEYSPYANVTPDDPPTYLFYPTPPALGQPEKDPTHSANFGVKLQEKARSAGLDCELVYPGAPDVKHPTIADYLIDRLTQRSTSNVQH